MKNSESEQEKKADGDLDTRPREMVCMAQEIMLDLASNLRRIQGRLVNSLSSGYADRCTALAGPDAPESEQVSFLVEASMHAESELGRCADYLAQAASRPAEEFEVFELPDSADDASADSAS